MLLHALSLRVERDGKPPVEATAPLPPTFVEAGFGDVRLSLSTSPRRRWRRTFLAASGPGGQNVNKVATACQLRCDVFRLGLAPDVYARLKALAGSRMTGAARSSSPPATTAPRRPIARMRGRGWRN